MEALQRQPNQWRAAHFESGKATDATPDSKGTSHVRYESGTAATDASGPEMTPHHPTQRR